MTPAETANNFAPDSCLVTKLHPSPNINERRDNLKPETLILHYTGLPTVERSIAVLADPVCQVSCHYVIDEIGTITQMVPEAMRAWHAGVSYWKGITDINSWSIGIEIQNPGHELGYPDFPVDQMASVIALSKDIIERNKIPGEHVLAHSDIAPLRKIDPGEKFPWSKLAASGVGHWIEPSPIESEEDQPEKNPIKASVANFQAQLKRYGYGCPQTGELDEETKKYIAAFQRHFRPGQVNGILDQSTIQTLDRLIEALPAASRKTR
ncbi:MAG: N-acetylmuramoyl-L-alanine amidase [Pseudomonadota bacterium]